MTKENDAEAPKRSESEVYDRQIRLWGAEAQAKMSKAKVLYINLAGVSTEVLKNLVLAGIKAVICDQRPYPEAVAGTPSFFLPAKGRAQDEQREGNSPAAGEDEPAAKKMKYATVADAMKPVVEELNPLLGTCEVVSKSVAELDKEFVSQFPIVIASRINIQDAIRLSKATVDKGGKFYMTDSFGMYGACAFDLGANHEYRPEKGKELLDPTTLKVHVPLETLFTKVSLAEATNRFHKKAPPPAWILYRCILEYADQTKTWPSEETSQDFAKKVRAWVQKTSPSLLDHDLLTEKSLQGVAKVATSEVAPICSVLGGIIGNEVIKAISGKGEPANNTLLFDGLTCKAWTFLVKPKEGK